MRPVVAYAAGPAAAVLLALAGRALAPETGRRCARDGVEIGRLLEVVVESSDGVRRPFCSVRCAEDWIARTRTGVVRVLVSDEAGGSEVDATTASWVRSRVATSARTGERLHAFARREDAEAHARAHGGIRIEDEERPFHFVR